MNLFRHRSKELDTEHTVVAYPPCDFCKQDWRTMFQAACYHGVTQLGVKANMCEYHFQAYGMGLGHGKGQRLILR